MVKYTLLFCCLLFETVALSFSGGDGSVSTPYTISSEAEFYDMNSNLSAHYSLVADIDLSSFTYSSAIIAPDSYRSGVSFHGTPFTGSLEGNGHTISGDKVAINSTSNFYAGLFGQIGEGGLVKNLIVANCQISSVSQFAGGLCADLNGGTIDNCSITGAVTGTAYVGGICGSSSSGQVLDSSAECTINGTLYVGGLSGNDSGGSYTSCYSNSDITVSFDRAGGLVGYGDGVSIFQCYTAGEVSFGTDYGGGICGFSSNSTIEQSYSMATVTGIGTVSESRYIGGICGWAEYSVISDCYNIGALSGEGAVSYFIGGLIGYGGSTCTVTNCYSAASVSSSSGYFEHIGGAFGRIFTSNPAYTITGCFWDTEVSGQSGDLVATPLTTEQMQIQSNFTGADWDFVGESANGTDYIWWMSIYGGYPKLDWQIKLMGMENFNSLATYWDQTGCTAGTECYDADWYRDGTIDENDLIRLSMSWLDREVIIYEP